MCAGAVHTTACPCVTHRNSCPPHSSGPLCLLYVYDGEMPVDMDADSTLVVPEAIAFFDRGDSWPTSLCPSLCVRRKHMYIPQFRALIIFLLNEEETYILASYMLLDF